MAEIKTSKDNFKIVPIEKIIPSPRNNNRHSIEQLERLAKIIEHRGFREPLTVSKRSGFVVCGHARLEAAKILGMTELPVIEQDFESEAEEYSHLTSANEIARWAELDLHETYNAVEEFGLSELEIELLGIQRPLDIEQIEVDDFESDEAINLESFISTVKKEVVRISKGGVDEVEATLKTEAYVLNFLQHITWGQVESSAS